MAVVVVGVVVVNVVGDAIVFEKTWTWTWPPCSGSVESRHRWTSDGAHVNVFVFSNTTRSPTASTSPTTTPTPITSTTTYAAA